MALDLYRVDLPIDEYKTLLDKGFPPNGTKKILKVICNTPLQEMVIGGAYEKAEMLLRYGANIHLLEDQALYKQARREDVEEITFFLRHGMDIGDDVLKWLEIDMKDVHEDDLEYSDFFKMHRFLSHTKQ